MYIISIFELTKKIKLILVIPGLQSVDAHFLSRLRQTKRELIRTICHKPKGRQVTWCGKAQDRAAHDGPRGRWVMESCLL